MIKLAKDLIIRSSSAEFLVFERQKGEKGIEVRFEDGDLWLTQKAIADLFNTSKQDVSYHLKNIFSTLELDENSVVKKYLTTASDNKKYNTNYYNLDAVISIGFRVNSDRAIQFRRWSINILKEFAKKGYIIDKKRMENGIFFDEDYFESLLAEIRAKRNIPMTMEDWSSLLDKYLLLDNRDILKDAGKISHEIARDKALTEFEKYRIKQDKLYKSDFDLLLEESNQQ